MQFCERTPRRFRLLPNRRAKPKAEVVADILASIKDAAGVKQIEGLFPHLQFAGKGNLIVQHHIEQAGLFGGQQRIT